MHTHTILQVCNPLLTVRSKEAILARLTIVTVLQDIFAIKTSIGVKPLATTRITSRRASPAKQCMLLQVHPSAACHHDTFRHGVAADVNSTGKA
jgi:hypothetical protein